MILKSFSFLVFRFPIPKNREYIGGSWLLLFSSPVILGYYLALLILQTKQFYVIGIVLFLPRCLAAFLASTHQRPVASPSSCSNLKCLQTLQKVPWVVKSLTFLPIPPSSVKNHGCGPITHCFPSQLILQGPQAALHFAYLAPSNCQSSHSQAQLFILHTWGSVSSILNWCFVTEFPHKHPYGSTWSLFNY